MNHAPEESKPRRWDAGVSGKSCSADQANTFPNRPDAEPDQDHDGNGVIRAPAASQEGTPLSSTGEALGRFQATDKPSQFRYKSGISGKRPLRCERVNEVAFKITDGEMSRVPASHGQWGGYNTPRALAWVIDIGSTAGDSPASWLARCGDRASGPFPFNEAKTAAFAMAKGVAGDVGLNDPIKFMLRLQAELIDSGSRVGSDPTTLKEITNE